MSNLRTVPTLSTRPGIWGLRLGLLLVLFLSVAVAGAVAGRGLVSDDSSDSIPGQGTWGTTDARWDTWVRVVAGSACVALVLAAVPLGNRFRLARLNRQLDRREYTSVAWAIGLVFRSRRTGPRAALCKTTAMLVLGEFHKATEFLNSLSPPRRPDPATYHLLRAHAAAGQGDMREARQDLNACLELDPSYTVEAAAISALRPLMAASGGDPYA